MVQNPIFENSFLTGVIVNDANYVPVDEKSPKMPDEIEDASNDCGCKERCGCCSDKTEEFCLEPCEEFVEITVHNVRLHCEGRIIKAKVQLKDICKGRKIRLAVLLFEKECHEEELKGLRVCEIDVPGFPNGRINEVTVGDFCFILPEESIYDQKNIRIDVIAHYSSFPQKYVPEH